MAYDIGKWTNSTVETLQFIFQSNQNGVKPKLKDFPSNTFRNWIYPLKDAGHIEFDDGFQLTVRGTDLLHHLIKNPPEIRRKKTRRTRSSAEQQMDNDTYNVSINGNDFRFDALLTKEQAKEIVKAISEIKWQK